MKRILISDVYHIVLGNKNTCLLAKMMHLSKHLYDLSLLSNILFVSKKYISVSLPPSPFIHQIYAQGPSKKEPSHSNSYKINFSITSE